MEFFTKQITPLGNFLQIKSNIFGNFLESKKDTFPEVEGLREVKRGFRERGERERSEITTMINNNNSR